MTSEAAMPLERHPDGDINGRILSPVRDYAENRLGAAGGLRFDAALRAHGYGLATALDPYGWVSIEALHVVIDELRPVLGENMLVESILWAVPRRVDFSAASLNGLASPAFVYRNLDRARSFFARHLSFDVRVSSATDGDFVLRYAEGVPRRRESCEVALGILQAVPLLFGLPAAKVVHRGRCYADGGTECAYHARWATQRPWASYGAAVGVLVAVAGALLDPSFAWLLAPPFGFFLGREFAEIARRRFMTQVAAQQRRLLEEHEREFERRYDEIRRLNNALEVRVEERTAALKRAMDELAQQNRVLHESLRQMEEMQGDVVDAALLTMMGQRMAEFAHEIRNPMHYVISNLQFLETPPKTPEALAEITGAASDVRSGIERMQAVLSWFLELNRGGNVATRNPYDLVAEVERTVGLFRGEVDGRIEVRTELAALEPFAAYGRELTQVLVNLLTNASHAMRRGTVTVRVWEAGGDLAPRDALPGTVGFTVIDDGPGIPREVQARLFERGFTTKPEGRGSGLGLFISRAIVERHRGRIRVESEPGRGTTVHVEIPRG